MSWGCRLKTRRWRRYSLGCDQRRGGEHLRCVGLNCGGSRFWLGLGLGRIENWWRCLTDIREMSSFLAPTAGLTLGRALVLRVTRATTGVANASLSTLAWSRLGSGPGLTCIVLRGVWASVNGWRTTAGLGTSSPILVPVLLLVLVGLVPVAAGERVGLASVRVKSG